MCKSKMQRGEGEKEHLDMIETREVWALPPVYTRGILLDSHVSFAYLLLDLVLSDTDIGTIGSLSSHCDTRIMIHCDDHNRACNMG